MLIAPLRNFSVAIGCAAFLSSCASSPFYGRPMTERIAADVSAFNQAYFEAANSQILLNVLYSRDRLPRQYTGFKEIATTQKRSVTGSAGLGSLKLGNPLTTDGASLTHPEKIWGVGTLTAGGSAEATPQYGVTPLTGDALNKATLGATSTAVFKHYWDSGWPKDVLLSVLVSDFYKLGEECPEPASKKSVLLLPEGGNLSDLLAARSNTTGGQGKCEDSKKIERPIERIRNSLDPDVRPHPKIPSPFGELAQKVSAGASDSQLSYGKLGEAPSSVRVPLKPIDAARVSLEEWQQLADGVASMQSSGYAPRFEGFGDSDATNDVVAIAREDKRQAFLILEHGGERYALALRSFDQAVYYLGELVRDQTDRPDVFGSEEVVKNADGNNCKVPLFQITRRGKLGEFVGGSPGNETAQTDADDPAWAGRVFYRGNWYYAGPSSPRKVDCGRNKVDRTGTVLTLLSQIFELNRSAANLALPARIGD